MSVSEPSLQYIGKEYIGKELDKLHPISKKYHTMSTPLIHVMFRLSTVPRRDNDILDYDIVQIKVMRPRKGIGTRFFENMVAAAKKRNRGVFLEQCITPDSKGFRAALIRKGLATAFKEDTYGDTAALSVQTM